MKEQLLPVVVIEDTLRDKLRDLETATTVKIQKAVKSFEPKAFTQTVRVLKANKSFITG